MELDENWRLRLTYISLLDNSLPDISLLENLGQKGKLGKNG